ncbi:MAG: hypothetical protein LBR22_10440 [Desulfovibrio sp.]|nr:hypothetical protein [Desulfovibrio sp.]
MLHQHLPSNTSLLLMLACILCVAILLVACVNEAPVEQNPLFGTWSVNSKTNWGKETNEGVWELTNDGAAVQIGDRKINRMVRYKLEPNTRNWQINIRSNPTRFGTKDFCDAVFDGKDKFTATDNEIVFTFTRTTQTRTTGT